MEMNLETVRRLADEAGFEPHEIFEGEFCGSLAMLQQFAELALSEATDEAWDDIKLAEMIMSDCGISSDYEPLKERIAKRIAKHVQSRTASYNSQLIAVLLNIGEWIQNLPIPTRGALAKLMNIDRAVAAVNAVPPTSGD